MFRVIDQLRNGSPEVKRRVGVVVTFFAVGAVLVLWLCISWVRSTVMGLPNENQQEPREINGIIAPY